MAILPGDALGRLEDQYLRNELRQKYAMDDRERGRVARRLKGYVIGSLRDADRKFNTKVAEVSALIRAEEFEVFDDWLAAGPEADDFWKHYEQLRGRSYKEALNGHAANHVFSFDKSHLDSSDFGVLVLPAGRSGHLELGYLAGRGKPVCILLDTPDRWDVMYKFAAVVENLEELQTWLKDLH